MILLGTLVTCLIICIIGSVSKTMLRYKKLFFVIMAFLLVIAVGFRVYNSGDYAQYTINFYTCSKMTWSQILTNTHKEYFQVILIKLLSSLGFKAQSYFFVATVITLYGFFSFITLSL